MGQLLGLLNIAEAAADKTFVSALSQPLVYDAIQELLANYNTELARIKRIFVEETTSDFKRRYKLPGSGRLQRRGGQAQSAAVKATGSWDVAFPLEDFGAQFGGDDIALAYMTAKELDRHLETVTIQDVNTVRFEIFKALFNNSERSFVDDIQGTLLVEPLANDDSVLYPPVLGTESEAVENHYLASGYTSANISDTNNPYPTIRRELVEHFGIEQGGEAIAVFHNSAETAKVRALTGFDSVVARFVNPGANVDVPTNLPGGLPGTVIGYIANGGWAVEWDWIPSGYMLGLHLEAPAPLIERIDPPETGLSQGLQLVAKEVEYPLESSHYRHRFGIGVGNRLNGVVMQLTTNGAYGIPSAYQ